MSNYLYLDIETIPSQRPEIKEEIAANIHPPGNMSKADTIAKWEIETKPDVIEKKWLETALDGAFGEVVSIAHLLESNTFLEQPKIEGDYRELPTSEKPLLIWFNETIEKIWHSFNGDVVFVGFNILNFDLRFLWQRMLINGLKPHTSIFNALNNSKYNSDRYFDIMLYWSGFSRQDWISQDKLCQAFGIESSKTEDIDGSKVWEHIKAGNYQAVLDYNKRDIEVIRKLHKLITF